MAKVEQRDLDFYCARVRNVAAEHRQAVTFSSRSQKFIANKLIVQQM